MYNEEQTIGELIERSKKYTDICVVNDGSKDKTADIVNSYSEVVQIIHQNPTKLEIIHKNVRIFVDFRSNFESF